MAGHRKLFRYELEQCKGSSAYGRNHTDPYLFPVKADRSVSAGRNVCAEYGGQYPCVPGASDSAFQCIFRMCDCICRVISFVGIAVPYLIKHLLGTAKPLVVIPATFLGGAVFCMGCDLIARMAFAPLELNISTVTSIFGAPIVIFMMIKGRKGK